MNRICDNTCYPEYEFIVKGWQGSKIRHSQPPSFSLTPPTPLGYPPLICTRICTVCSISQPPALVQCITCALATVSPSTMPRARIARIYISLPNILVRSLVSSGTILFVLSDYAASCIVRPSSRSSPVNLPQPSLALPFPFHPLPSELRSCRRPYNNTSFVA